MLVVDAEEVNVVAPTTNVIDIRHNANGSNSIDERATTDNKTASTCNVQGGIAHEPRTTVNLESGMQRVEHRAACLTRLASGVIQSVEHLVVEGLLPLTVADGRALFGAL